MALTFRTLYLYLGVRNLTFRGKLFLFCILTGRRTIYCLFHKNQCNFIVLFQLVGQQFLTFRPNLWPLNPHNVKSMLYISKIVTYLESLSQSGRFAIFKSDIQALLIFLTHYNRSLSPQWSQLNIPLISQITQWCQRGISVFLCHQDIG